MKKAISITMAVLLFATFLELLALYRIPSFHLPFILPGSSVSSDPSSNSKIELPPPLPSGFTLLYRDKDDPSGRTFLVGSADVGNSHDGSGEVFHRQSGKLSYIAGTFRSFEDIPGSDDRYIIMDDPVNNTAIPKYRIVVGTASGAIRKYPTKVQMEDVSKLGRGYPESVVSLFSLENTDSLKQLSSLLRQGDAVILAPYFRYPDGFRVDSSQVIEVKQLVLRRIGGKDAL